MKQLPGEASLVIAGQWNPAILTPSWIGREVFGYPADKVFNVGVEMTMGSGTGTVVPRFLFENLSLQVLNGNLAFGLTSSVQIPNSISVAARICEILGYTPVTGVGFNLGYQANSVDAQLAARFASADLAEYVEGGQTAAMQIGSRIKVGDCLMNVMCLQDQAVTKLNINVHFEVASAAAAAAVLRRHDIYQWVKSRADTLASGITKEGIEE